MPEVQATGGASRQGNITPRLILGIDPGKRSGVALIAWQPKLPWHVLYTWTIPLEELPLEIASGVVAAAVPKERTIAAVETYRMMGAAKIRGVAAQAYAAGVAVAACRIAELAAVVELTRNEVLRAAGFPKACSKADVRRRLPMLLTPRYVPENVSRNEHERDAALTAFVAGVRMIEMQS